MVNTTLNAIVSNFLSFAGETRVIAHEGSKFQADPARKEIAFTLHEKRNYGFTEDFRSRSPESKEYCDMILSLLHELGHVKTEGLVRVSFTYKKRDEYIEQAKRLVRSSLMSKYELDECSFNIQMELNEGFHHEYLMRMNNYYRQMPDERAATEWAIRWLRDPRHQEMARALEAEIAKTVERPE